VDHTGIDIIAYNLTTKQRLGITVKSRTRSAGKEEAAVNLFSYQKGRDDRQKLLDACEAFGCEPWIAVYVECLDSVDLYLTSLKNYDEKYRGKEGKAIDKWKMRRKDKVQYEKDTNVKHIQIHFQAKNWEWLEETPLDETLQPTD